MGGEVEGILRGAISPQGSLSRVLGPSPGQRGPALCQQSLGSRLSPASVPTSSQVQVPAWHGGLAFHSDPYSETAVRSWSLSSPRTGPAVICEAQQKCRCRAPVHKSGFQDGDGRARVALPHQAASQEPGSEMQTVCASGLEGATCPQARTIRRFSGALWLPVGSLPGGRPEASPVGPCWLNPCSCHGRGQRALEGPGQNSDVWTQL